MGEAKRNCLALGGGGARGLSHLGVLQVLEREGVSVDAIVGTSAGAVVGAAYALNPSATEITRVALKYFRESAERSSAFKKVLLGSEDAEQNFVANLISSIKKGYVFSALLRRPSIFPTKRLMDVISDLVPDKQFSDTQIPFAVPALDIRSGEEVLLREGSIREAVLASCSLPGFFPPVAHGEQLLVDAGVIGPVPVSAAHSFRPGHVIAVDITSQLPEIVEITQGLDAILRVETIACKRLNDLELERADVVIRPNVGEKYWSDFSGLDALISEGVGAAELVLDELRRLSRPLASSSAE